jgi:molecular chaperone Hsp33
VHDRDSLRRFLFEHYPIRGHLVHLDASWRALIEHREYPDSIRTALGETVVAALLLAATIKFDGVLSLQLQGPGPVHLLLAQCTSGLGVRGLARYREASTEGGGSTRGSTGESAGGLAGESAGGSTGESAGESAGGIAGLVGAGNLTVTLQSDDGSQRYQGIVPISGARLADSLQIYFENSEQLPTRLWLYADERGAAGMLLQRLPDGDRTAASGSADSHAADIDDAWRRVQLIGATLTPDELRSLADAEIVHRLFNEDDVRIFEPAPVYFRCRCSRERVSGMLQGLGESETRSVLAERGAVEVRCDFCNRAYVFDAVDVATLFNGGLTGDAGGLLH